MRSLVFSVVIVSASLLFSCGGLEEGKAIGDTGLRHAKWSGGWSFIYYSDNDVRRVVVDSHVLGYRRVGEYLVVKRQVANQVVCSGSQYLEMTDSVEIVVIDVVTREKLPSSEVAKVTKLHNEQVNALNLIDLEDIQSQRKSCS